MTQQQAAERIGIAVRTFQRRLKKLADDPEHTYQKGDDITEELILEMSTQPKTTTKRKPKTDTLVDILEPEDNTIKIDVKKLAETFPLPDDKLISEELRQKAIKSANTPNPMLNLDKVIEGMQHRPFLNPGDKPVGSNPLKGVTIEEEEDIEPKFESKLQPIKKKSSFSEEFENRRRKHEEEKRAELEKSKEANAAIDRKLAIIFTEPRTRFFLLILILSDSLYSGKIAFESQEGIYSYVMATALFFVGGAIGYVALMNIASYTGRDREAWQWGFMVWQFTLHGCGMTTFGDYSTTIGQIVLAIGAAMATAAASLTLNKDANR